MQLFKRSLVTLAALASLTSLPALAEGNLQSFAAPAYDARHGGQQASLDALLADPAGHYRSDAVYAKARAIMGDTMDLKLTDAAFKKMLRSDRVSVAACNDVFKGAFTLAAVDDSAKAYWTSRTCDAGEQVVLLDGIPIMSLACLNPIKLPPMDCKCGTVYYEWRQQHPKG